MKKTKKIKKVFFSIAFLSLMGALLFVGCKPETKEEKESQEKLQEAKENVVIAKKNANAEEWQAFKDSTDSVINENEIRITDLKVKMKNTGKSIDAKYEKNIALIRTKKQRFKSQNRHL